MFFPEKREAFIKMWMSGSSIKEIASTIGIRTGMVGIYARIFGLSQRKQPQVNQLTR